jgi:hypothetical protein
MVSAGVGVWKDVLKAAHIPARKAAVASPAPPTNSVPPAPIFSLVQRIFFPAVTVRRTRVLFAGADAGTRVFAVCERIGRALAEMSGATVAIMEALPASDSELDFRKEPNSSAGSDQWRRYSSQIAGNVWRVSAPLMSNRPYPAGPGRWMVTETSNLPFDYVLFAAAVGDSETAAFCSVCDGAVLVLTASQTRRESALRAQEQLLQCNTELLGAVLDGRTFPIPEAIYRRL